MSVVIIGGNERMECQYREICRKYKCKAKVFTRMAGNLKTQIGQPDLIILFTSTVAHKMVHCALREAQRHDVRVERSHSASASALDGILRECPFLCGGNRPKAGPVRAPGDRCSWLKKSP